MIFISGTTGFLTMVILAFGLEKLRHIIGDDKIPA